MEQHDLQEPDLDQGLLQADVDILQGSFKIAIKGKGDAMRYTQG